MACFPGRRSDLRRVTERRSARSARSTSGSRARKASARPRHATLALLSVDHKRSCLAGDLRIRVRTTRWCVGGQRCPRFAPDVAEASRVRRGCVTTRATVGPTSLRERVVPVSDSFFVLSVLGESVGCTTRSGRALVSNHSGDMPCDGARSRRPHMHDAEWRLLTTASSATSRRSTPSNARRGCRSRENALELSSRTSRS